MPTRTVILFALYFAILGTFAGAACAQAQQPAPAPLPAQILSAQKIFISNAGGEMDPNTKQVGEYPRLPDRPYNQFYVALKSWGRYQVVSAPAEADLIFEIGFGASQFAGTEAVGKFQLRIRDPESNALLWAFTEYVQGAILLGNREKNFDQGVATIMADVKRLAA